MWPFNNLKEKLRKHDAMEKYRQWLKKWRLKGAKFARPALICLTILMVTALIFTKFYTITPVQPTNNPTTPPPTVEQKQQPKPTTENKKTAHVATQPAIPPVDINQLAMPVSGQVLLGHNQPYYSAQYDDYRFNSGILFQTEDSSPVTAALAGKVTAVELDQNQGFTITIDHGQGYQTQYQGLNTVQVAVNQQVDQGDMLGANQNQLQFTVTHHGTPIDPLQQATSK